MEPLSRSTAGPSHLPVMAREAIGLLLAGRVGLYLDATVGAGGHSGLLLRADDRAAVIAFDRDDRAIAAAGEALAEFGDRVELVREDFRKAPAALAGRVLSGALIDLGVSSLQLDDPNAGFSFRRDGPLDMRMDRRQERTAADIVNESSAEELAALLWRFGEERRSRAVARAVAARRSKKRFSTTGDLAEVVRRAVGRRGRERIDAATRTFQALRIAVNDELQGLDDFIRSLVDLMEPGARLVVITFHSLEDRIVKGTLAALAGRCSCPPGLPECRCGPPRVALITRKPMRPSDEDIQANPRCRSARLRAAEKPAGGSG